MNKEQFFKDLENNDIFIKDFKYKNPKNIFSMEIKPIEEVINDCIFVLDANILLFPYSTSAYSLKEIEKTYQNLIKQNRICIPCQVAREFVDNRPNKLVHIIDKLKDESINKISLEKLPIFELNKTYKELVSIEKEINQEITNIIQRISNDYNKKIKLLREQVESWNFNNDPISLVYKELFSSDIIVDYEYDKESFLEELYKRYSNEVPPGYKDKTKTDKGVGDLLIWKTILQIAKDKKKHIIFVSNDQKSDWWIQKSNKALYPRYELIDEFYNYTDGYSIYFSNFSRFLSLLNAPSEVIEEVKKEEKRIIHKITLKDKISALEKWLDEEFEESGVYEDINYIGVGDQGFTGIEAFYEEIPFELLKKRILDLIIIFNELSEKANFSNFFILIFKDNDYISDEERQVTKYFSLENVQIKFCRVEEENLHFIE